MQTREIIAVTFTILLSVALGISVFAGNQKDKLTLKMVLVMAITGIAAGVLTWTYLQDGEKTKVIVRQIMIYAFSSTVLSKLFGRIINTLNNIDQKTLKDLLINFIKKWLNLKENDDEQKPNIYPTDTDCNDADINGNNDSNRVESNGSGNPTSD